MTVPYPSGLDGETPPGPADLVQPPPEKSLSTPAPGECVAGVPLASLSSPTHEQQDPSSADPQKASAQSMPVADADDALPLAGGLPSAPVLSIPSFAEPRWIRPAPPNDISVSQGPYRGRPQVGDVGGMLRVMPSVRSKLSGSHVPDSVVDAGVLSDSVSIGVVSIKGASHHLSATPRQDSYAIGTDESWAVIAIADGVSEGKLSHVAATDAARVTVAESLRALTASTPDLIDWRDVADKAREAVRALGLRRAQQQAGGVDPAPDISDRTIARIMATTCDVLITPVERREGLLRVWRIRIAGDGSFYVLDPSRGWGLLNSGKDTASSTIDNSVSDPLPLGGDNPDVEYWDLAPGQAAVLCTDGFGDVIGEGARPVGRYLFDAWQLPLDTVQLLWSASFVNTNADDDRTATIVWATQ